MRELPVCQDLLREVLDIAREHHAERVEQVVLRVGPLSGIEPNLLADAFPFASAGTRAEGAELIIESAAVRVRCLTCGAETDTTPNRLLCGHCSGIRTQLMSGDELRLVSVQLSGTPQLATHH
ncbi:MAG: hydrogenase maturation nickel metallochaperone HypA [Gammaproteobacteria bacterium]|nr:hydrogenase maturation nickel metallochaperone HypA [Gammaproteobacteria bacterium]